MSLVRDTLRKLRIDFDDFWAWGEKASQGKHKRLFDSYDRAMKALDDAEEEFTGIWLQKNIDKDTFEKGYERWRLRLDRLDQKVVIRLERILKAYKKDVEEDATS
jgi:hypothetical protein